MAAEVGVPVQQRLRRRLGQLGVVEMLEIALVAILVVTALLGGLDTVDTKVTPIAAGESFDDGEFTMTIERAGVVKELATTNLVRPKVGFRYLGVVATVRNNGAVPGLLPKEIELRDHPEQEFIGAFRDADSTLILQLGPGLSESVVFVWRLPERALQTGGTVSLRVWRKKFQEGVIRYGKNWIQTGKYFEITLPVKVNQ